MKTLTINIPDSLDPAVARWEMARALYDKGSLTLEQAASLAGLAPTYFSMRLNGLVTGVSPKIINLFVKVWILIVFEQLPRKWMYKNLGKSLLL